MLKELYSFSVKILVKLNLIFFAKFISRHKEVRVFNFSNYREGVDNGVF